MLDPREIEMMAHFRSIMEGNVQEPVRTNAEPKVIGNISDPKADMKAILEMLNSQTEKEHSIVTPQSPIKQTQTFLEDKEFKEALMTERTPTGVKVGSWEIKVNEDKSGLTTYDVVNTYTNDPIAMDLTLYETALSLTKLLNFHVGINSQQVREVLDLEQKYSQHRHDAALFKVRHKQRIESGDVSRAAIAEDRYLESRAKALQLREQIQTICARL